MEGNVISVERVIVTPASDLFRIVADAHRHPEIDGSGSVVKPKSGTPQALTLGSTFGMSMKMGVPYSMSNTVIEFDQDRRIAWKTVSSGSSAGWSVGGFGATKFEPVEGGTLVRESWDISQDKQASLLKLGKMPSTTTDAMTTTLANLAKLAERPPVG